MRERHGAVRLERRQAKRLPRECRPRTIGRVKEPDDADVPATGFWLDADLESMLATVQPYEGASEFAIEDLTDEEWDRFVAALRE